MHAFHAHLGMEMPVIQAPMAGGGDTPALVAAVSNAGGLGCFGAAYSTPEQIVATGEVIRSRTQKPFAVNLFAPLRATEAGDAGVALSYLWKYYDELGIPAPSAPEPPKNRFDEQLEAALSIGASALSFTFNVLSADAVRKVKSKGVLLLGTATTVEEGLELQRIGVDAVIAQGGEAGGHRGTFLGDFQKSMVGLISLVPQMKDALSVPVIASGGIMDGRGIVAALTLGASAAQLGTAFLLCAEAGIPECYKTAILEAHEDQIVTTTAFSGRPARGVENRFMREMREAEASGGILPFPLQNALTRPLRTAAGQRDKAEMLSLWAGQGVRMGRRQTAAELMARLKREINEVLRAQQNLFASDDRQSQIA